MKTAEEIRQQIADSQIHAMDNGLKRPRVKRDELDLEVIELYKKKNCRKCLGRGYRVTEIPKYKWGFRHGEPHLQIVDYCDCVLRAQKKMRSMTGLGALD